MCFIWLSQKGLHEWTFPASAIRGVRYCALMGILPFPYIFFLFSIAKLAAGYSPTSAALFRPQSSDFSLNRPFFHKLPRLAGLVDACYPLPRF